MPDENKPNDSALDDKDKTPDQNLNKDGAIPKLEIKDGKVLVDGKAYVRESDLLASKESLTKQLESAQAVHNEAVEKLRLEIDSAQKAVAKANADLEEAKKAKGTGGISAEDLATAKKEAEDAKKALETVTTSALDSRRKLLMVTYKIDPNSDTGKELAGKTSAELDSFESAIKALNLSKGAGNYAIGDNGHGTPVISSIDRAKNLINGTPYRGVRAEVTK